MKLLNTILENNNPKLEINHILADSENYVATNGKTLIIKKHNMGHIFEDKKCLIINPKAKYEIRIDGIEAQMTVNTSQAGSYPEYHRIIPQHDKNYSLDGTQDGVDFLYQMTCLHQFIFDFVGNHKFCMELKNIRLNWYKFKHPRLPVSFGNDEYEIVIMPMVFKDVTPALPHYSELDS